MKKILISAFAIMFATATYAQNVSIGVSGMALYYDASGTETVKSSNQQNSKSEDGVAPIPSIFIEKETANGGVIGLDIVPFAATVVPAFRLPGFRRRRRLRRRDEFHASVPVLFLVHHHGLEF